MSMTADQLLDEIKALPQTERERLFGAVCQLFEDDVPADFMEALQDFDSGRFVSLETAMEKVPPGA